MEGLWGGKDALLIDACIERRLVRLRKNRREKLRNPFMLNGGGTGVSSDSALHMIPCRLLS
jgi:hypothetical protein